MLVAVLYFYSCLVITDGASRRYIELVPPNLDDWEMVMFSNQQTQDRRNEPYTPSIDQRTEPLVEHTRLGAIELGEIVYRGVESIIFESENLPHLLVKYQANCDELGDVHPLIYDYWLMKEAFQVGLAPEPIFLSPATLLIDDDSLQKISFSMDRDMFENCVQERGTVRYMVMRKSAGIDLNSLRGYFKDGIMPMRVASEILVHVIHALARMHDNLGIVHGDIHPGNILVESDAESVRIVFVDFGRASRDRRDCTNERINEVGAWFHPLCSPWQIDGRTWSRRDDVYKAVHMFASLINPFEYGIREQVFFDQIGPSETIARKRDNFMFVMAPPVTIEGVSYASTFNPIVHAVKDSTADPIQLALQLRVIQRNATHAVDDINAPIPYADIVNGFRSIQQILR